MVIHQFNYFRTTFCIEYIYIQMHYYIWLRCTWTAKSYRTLIIVVKPINYSTSLLTAAVAAHRMKLILRNFRCYYSRRYSLIYNYEWSKEMCEVEYVLKLFNSIVFAPYFVDGNENWSLSLGSCNRNL